MKVNFVCQQNTYFWILNVLVLWCGVLHTVTGKHVNPDIAQNCILYNVCLSMHMVCDLNKNLNYIYQYVVQDLNLLHFNLD